MTRLDERYFENKFRAIMAAYHADLITKIDDILKQIARDAAEAQRGRCYNAKFACQKEGCVDCSNFLTIPASE